MPTDLAAPAHSYAHVAKPMRPQTRFTLRGDTLAIDDGPRETIVPLAAIEAIRLTVEIRNTLTRSFRTGLRIKGKGALGFDNASWRRLAEIETHDEAYCAFVADLVRVAARENPAIRLEAGQTKLRWWGFVLLALLTGAGVAALIVRALQAGTLPFAALLLVFALGFGWLLADVGRRNRPRPFTPDALPADLLPALAQPASPARPA